MKRSFLYIIIITVLGVTSCSKFGKLLKSSDYPLKYSKAFEYYHKADYVRAAQLFDDIYNAYRGTNKADTLAYYRAMSYFKQKDYLNASYYFSSIYKNDRQSPFAEESEYLAGYCFYKQSPRPELDQENTFAAIETFQIFLVRHPGSNWENESKKYLAEMQDKLVDKSYISAKLYYNLSQYKASIVALNNSLNDYPDTKYREELMFLLLRSSYLLAENSVPDKKKERYQSALDEYYSFIGEFPESAYAKEAKQKYEKTDRSEEHTSELSH